MNTICSVCALVGSIPYISFVINSLTVHFGERMSDIWTATL